jgi:hypothetical protein
MFGFDDAKQRVRDATGVEQTLDKWVLQTKIAIHFAGSPCEGDGFKTVTRIHFSCEAA